MGPIEESQTINSQMVKLRTALVLLLCASVGVHAGVSLKDLVEMTPQGGLVNTWLYEKAVEVSGINTTVVCINTTNATDPCTHTIVMPGFGRNARHGRATYMSFGLKKTDDTPFGDSKVTVTPKAGSSGIMASNSRAADLLNHDKDPMKTIIAGGKLKEVWCSVYATIRKKKDSLITFSLISNDDELMTYQGKLSVDKISMCYGVQYLTSSSSAAVPQGSTCASKKVFKVTECHLVPKHGDLGEKTGRKNKNRRKRKNKNRTSKKNRTSEKKTKEPTKAPTNQNCEPHIMDGLQNAAAQRL